MRWGYRWPRFAGFIIGILNGGDGEQDGGLFQEHLGHGRDVFRNLSHAVGVDIFRPFLFAQAHRHHFAGAAFHFAPEGIVGLQPAGDDDPVRLIGVLSMYTGRPDWLMPR